MGTRNLGGHGTVTVGAGPGFWGRRMVRTDPETRGRSPPPDASPAPGSIVF